jgi:hypothetical protein
MRFNRPSDENSVDCDELAVITAQLLQPNPDILEINHMLKYLLTKIVGVASVRNSIPGLGSLCPSIA